MTPSPGMPDGRDARSRSAAGDHRLHPLAPNRVLLLRPRLLQTLQGRFRSRMTRVSAGPGFGKTTLMAQAMTENLLAPLGTDLWVTCRSGDDAASSLASALCAALGLEQLSWDADDVRERVIEELWRRAPEQVALIFDDAQLIGTTTSAAGLLRDVSQQMPANAHLVLVGREPMPLPSARLAAQGLLTEVDEGDLLFTAEELAEFAGMRDVSVASLAGTGGWPALAELSACARHRVADYVWEEILARIPGRDRRILAALTLVDRFDDELAEALADEPVDLATLLVDLPLVTGRAGEDRSLHALWRSALAGQLRRDEESRARRRAAAVLHRRGDLDAAVRLFAAANAWSGVDEIICAAAASPHPLVAPDVLRNWYGLLPREHRSTPEGQLLRALLVRNEDLRRAVPLFDRAADGFRAGGNVSGELAALTHVAHITWWCNDLVRLDAAVARMNAMAQTLPFLHPIAAMGRTLVADARADFSTALMEMSSIAADDVPDSMAAGVEWMWAWELLLLGRPEAARQHAEAAVTHARGTFLAAALNVAVLSRWLSGAIEEALVELPRFTASVEATWRGRGHVFERSQASLLLCLAGRREDAEALLRAARSMSPPGNTSTTADIAKVLAEAALLVVDGDEDRAHDLLAAEVRHRPLQDLGPTRWHRLFPAMTYVLVPSTRPWWDQAAVGPSQARSLALARALARARDGMDLSAVAALDLSDTGEVRCHVPAVWATELALWGLVSGNSAAPALLDGLGQEARPHVRRLASGDRRLATSARSVLSRARGFAPDRLELRVLGVLQILREGRPVEHPDLRRERVRQLLGYLLTRAPVPRTTAAATLWPDLAPEAAMRNLRVTLNYLRRVLEPDRPDGEPPYFLRTDGGLLSLHTGEALTVDAEQFDRHVRSAAQAERTGVPSRALASYRRAVALYRDDYLSDLPDAEWAEGERDRRRMALVSAAVRAGELLLATGDTDRPVDLALRALGRDQYCEAAHRLLVAALIDRGEVDSARQAYRRCLGVLADVGVRVDAATEVLGRRLVSAASAAASGRPPR